MNNSRWSFKFKDCKEVGRFVGSVPSGILKNTTSTRVALFGDAAGICKPTTGGGIGPGFAHIDIIVDDFIDLIRKNKLDATSLSKIDKKIDKMRKSQSRARALRDAFLSHSTDNELEEIFKVFFRIRPAFAFSFCLLPRSGNFLKFVVCSGCCFQLTRTPT